MNRDRLKWVGLFTLVAGMLFGCGGGSFKQEDKPENLKAFFELIHETIHVKKDAKQAAALFQSMVPDQARLKKALKDDIAPATTQQITDLHKSFTISEDGVRKLARADQKEVQVHGSRTEDILKYEPGSVAYKEFPGGAKRVAELALRPGTTFYEVEYLEPGKDAGMKYHLIYWDGKQWSMLGPVWRALKP